MLLRSVHLGKRKISSFLAASALVIGTGLFFLQPISTQAWGGGNYYGSCANPVGTPTVSYNSGYHWVVGSSQLQWGSDAVYNNGSNQYRQCFCPLTQNNQPTSYLGVQTDWIPASSVSSQQKQIMLSSGWTSIANGSEFGLPAIEYLAKNVPFSCSHPSYIQYRNSVFISQNNQSYISNNVYSNMNTGGNRGNSNTGGNTSIVTGNASTSTSINTDINNNYIHLQSMHNWMDNFSANIEDNEAFSSNTINH